MRRISLFIAALLILLALSPRSVRAAGASPPEPTRDASRGWNLELQVALGQIANAVRSVLETTGCAIDPLGICAPTLQRDTGCAIDPAGGTCRD